MKENQIESYQKCLLANLTNDTKKASRTDLIKKRPDAAVKRKIILSWPKLCLFLV